MRKSSVPLADAPSLFVSTAMLRSTVAMPLLSGRRTTAQTAAKVAAAMSTGGAGLAVLGGSLLAKPTGDAGAPCQVALGHTSSGGVTTTSAAATKQPATPAEDVSRALGKLLGK